MISIDNYDFKGKRAIIRVDFNVPLNEKGEVTDDTRIRAAMPTVKKVLAGGGSVILMSHMGRPKRSRSQVLARADRSRRREEPRREGRVRRRLHG